jgi:predicted acylesterase/phospholipase RssA
VLVIGAASVLSGQLRKFNSSKEPIRIEHLLASAAVPNLFPAVRLDGDALWAGLFSDNPPLDDLVRKRIVGAGNIPHESWVIKINPGACNHAGSGHGIGGYRGLGREAIAAILQGQMTQAIGDALRGNA